MRRFLAGASGLLWIISAASLATAQTSLTNVILGHSAAVMDTGIMEEIKKSGFIDKLYGRS